MTGVSEPWRLRHTPALDGIRGVAVLLVLVGHLGPERLHPIAWIGVTAFFVLSGFLITALLLQERADTGTIRLRAFWVRRARRLLPALATMVAISSGFAIFAGLQTPPLLPVIGYFGNWAQAFGDDLGFWRHTWSLAIEEQFYTVWPMLLLILFRSRRLVALASGIGIGASLAAAVIARHDFDRLYYGTDTRVWALLAGSLVAALLVGSNRRACGWPAWLTLRPLRWFGLRSYGIYLWHYPLVIVLGLLGVPALVGILVSLPVAELSWRLVERPLLGGGSAHLAATPVDLIPLTTVQPAP